MKYLVLVLSLLASSAFAQSAERRLNDALGSLDNLTADFQQTDPLVIDKWFAIQAGSSRSDTLDRVRALTEHDDFNLGNPNRVRSLIGAFCSGNQVRFHASSGQGYVFLADYVLALNDSNPQVASRMVSVFNDWRRYDTDRQALMQAQLERIASSGSLSNDVYEIVNRALSR